MNRIIDVHTHTGYWPTLKETEKSLLNYVKHFNIDYCLFSFDGAEINDPNLSGRRTVSQIIAFSKAYSFLKQNNNKFGMLLWVQPNTDSDIVEVENFIKSHINNIFGLEMHPRLSNLVFTSEKYIKYFRLAEQYNLTTLVTIDNSEFSSLKVFKEVLKAWPHLLFVASFDFKNIKIKNILKLMKKYENLCIDTSSLNIDDLNDFLEENLLERIVYGSNLPNNNTIESIEYYQDYLQNKIDLNNETYNKIMYSNAIRIFNLII